MKRSGFQRKTPADPKPAKVRMRKCAVKSCRMPFAPRSISHKTCSPACAQAYVEDEKERKARQERQQGLAKLKRRADYMKEAQAALNAWIRLVRDKDKPCISCGRFHMGQWHAGHFLARGSHPQLALIESNLARQCMPCNVHLSGNQLMFRLGLIERIGLAAVEALESDQAPRKYSIEDLQAIKAHYRAQIRRSQKGAS